MQSDPFTEWQRLTEHYSKMYDGELLDLAADSVDLTEVARQVLRDEMKKRGLEEPRAASNVSQGPDRATARQWNSPVNRADSDSEESQQESDLPHEYTWKTVLCECEEREEAWQVSEVLRRAGIESWIEAPNSWVEGANSRYSVNLTNPRVLVAADRLDEAREIAARPIPQEIVDQSKMTAPEFELPACPNCGAADPVLEGVDPFNTWLCEACGGQWTESADGLNQNPERTE